MKHRVGRLQRFILILAYEAGPIGIRTAAILRGYYRMLPTIPPRGPFLYWRRFPTDGDPGLERKVRTRRAAIARAVRRLDEWGLIRRERGTLYITEEGALIARSIAAAASCTGAKEGAANKS